MEPICLTTNQQFTSTVEQLKNDFDEIVQVRMEEDHFANTEGSLTWIIRGGIDYFWNLDADFLGSGNDSGIPSMETDHFANNFYRLTKALDYLGKLWKISVDKSTEWKLLEDIRTIIVHSGEQVTHVESLALKEYKDTQLGRIFKAQETTLRIPYEFTKYDYRIIIWADKHDQSKKRPQNEVDYDRKNQNYRDIDILLSAKDVRQIVLAQIEKFIGVALNRDPQVRPVKKLPDAIKNDVIESMNIDKLEQLVRNKKRGGYIIENGIHVWSGFGLKRLWQYIEHRFIISNEVRTEIQKVIQRRLEKYWESYNNELVDDYDLLSLDVRIVFKEYTPKYELKSYLEGEKLFDYIAPAFNHKEGNDNSDIDYLLQFISYANKALDTELCLENTAEGIICDYFVKSVEKSLEAKIQNAR